MPIEFAIPLAIAAVAAAAAVVVAVAFVITTRKRKEKLAFRVISWIALVIAVLYFLTFSYLIIPVFGVY